MGFVAVLLFALIGFIGSFLSGLIGMGGAIVTYPMLLYIPAMMGVAVISAHQVSGIIALQVTAAASSGLYALRTERLVQFPLVGYMGSATLIGSFCGGFGAKFLSGSAVNLLYATLATMAAITMFVPKRETDRPLCDGMHFNKPLAVAIATVVGTLSGIVGVGGGFLLIPAMLWILKIPLRIAIACSMAITLISSIATSIAKILTLNTPWLPALIIVVSSAVAAPIGTRVAKRLTTGVLKSIAGVLILATSAKIWIDFT